MSIKHLGYYSKEKTFSVGFCMSNEERNRSSKFFLRFHLDNFIRQYSNGNGETRTQIKWSVSFRTNWLSFDIQKSTLNFYYNNTFKNAECWDTSVSVVGSYVQGHYYRL